MARNYAERGEPVFKQFASLPGPFGQISPADIDANDVRMPFDLPTSTRVALRLAEMYEFLSEHGRACDFAHAALRNLGRGVALKAPLEAILARCGG
jgi:hypothetical protein